MLAMGIGVGGAGGGGGAPGGTSGQVQYNNAGAFGGATGFIWSASGTTLSLTGQTSGQRAMVVTGAAGATTVLGLTGTGNLLEAPSGAGGLVIASNGAVTGQNVVGISGMLTYGTGSNCSSSAAPAVCGSSAAGSVVVAAAATTVTVNTTAVTANSQVLLTRDDSLGTKLSVTCNTATVMGEMKVSARTGGTSFTITVQTAPATNPGCISYFIIN